MGAEIIMTAYENEKIKAYTSELPAELRRVIDALNSDFGLAIFFVLFKYGKMSFSQIMSELDIPPHNSSNLTYHIKKLQKSSLVKNEYIKQKNIDGYSFYDITEFGEEIISNLMNTIQMPKSSNLSKQTLDEKTISSKMTRMLPKSENSGHEITISCAFTSDNTYKISINQPNTTIPSIISSRS